MEATWEIVRELKEAIQDFLAIPTHTHPNISNSTLFRTFIQYIIHYYYIRTVLNSLSSDVNTLFPELWVKYEDWGPDSQHPTL